MAAAPDGVAEEPKREFPWLAPMPSRFLVGALGFTLIAGSAVGMLNLLYEHGLMKPAPLAHGQTHGHAQLFGFIGVFVVGFAYHLLPRLVRRPLPHPRAAGATFWLLWGGSVLHWLGQPMARWWPGRVLLGLSGPLVAAGTAVFAFVVLRLLHRAELDRAELFREDRFERWLRAGVVTFALAGLFDGLSAVAAATTTRTGLYGFTNARLVWHLALSGLGLLFVVGVAIKVLPPLVGLYPPRRRAQSVAFWLLLLAVPLQAAGLVARGEPEGPLLELPGRVLSGLALVLIAFSFRLEQRGLIPASAKDPFFPWAARFAVGCLGVAGVLRLAAAVRELQGGLVDSFLIDAERHLITLGFLVGLILAMATKLLPGLISRPLRRPALRWWSGGLLAAGVGMRLFQLGGDAGRLWPLRVSAASGVVTFGAIALLAVMVISTVRAPGEKG